jgi:hypothetical protein
MHHYFATCKSIVISSYCFLVIIAQTDGEFLIYMFLVILLKIRDLSFILTLLASDAMKPWRMLRFSTQQTKTSVRLLGSLLFGLSACSPTEIHAEIPERSCLRAVTGMGP